MDPAAAFPRGWANLSTSDGCDGCGQLNSKLLRCSRCTMVKYCSTACQKRHWKAGHKEACQKTPAPGVISESDIANSGDRGAQQQRTVRRAKRSNTASSQSATITVPPPADESSWTTHPEWLEILSQHIMTAPHFDLWIGELGPAVCTCAAWRALAAEPVAGPWARQLLARVPHPANYTPERGWAIQFAHCARAERNLKRADVQGWAICPLYEAKGAPLPLIQFDRQSNPSKLLLFNKEGQSYRFQMDSTTTDPERPGAQGLHVTNSNVPAVVMSDCQPAPRQNEHCWPGEYDEFECVAIDAESSVYTDGRGIIVGLWRGDCRIFTLADDEMSIVDGGLVDVDGRPWPDHSVDEALLATTSFSNAAGHEDDEGRHWIEAPILFTGKFVPTHLLAVVSGSQYILASLVHDRTDSTARLGLHWVMRDEHGWTEREVIQFEVPFHDGYNMIVDFLYASEECSAVMFVMRTGEVYKCDLTEINTNQDGNFRMVVDIRQEPKTFPTPDTQYGSDLPDVTSAAVSADYTMLALGTQHGSVVLYCLGRDSAVFHSVATSANDGVQSFDTYEEYEEAACVGHVAYVSSVAFHPHKGLLATSGGEGDFMVYVWEYGDTDHPIQLTSRLDWGKATPEGPGSRSRLSAREMYEEGLGSEELSIMYGMENLVLADTWVAGVCCNGTYVHAMRF